MPFVRLSSALTADGLLAAETATLKLPVALGAAMVVAVVAMGVVMDVVGATTVMDTATAEVGDTAEAAPRAG